MILAHNQVTNINKYLESISYVYGTIRTVISSYASTGMRPFTARG